ncbi:acyl-CoA dehydrogenase [Nesterenkonia salmonea]|uniref:Acyl-CoA dehydrogenase n=1 Tax=Nesterenkonia salmonea TaxID=1804987 RepID=A0A5R9BAD7_9MICC|nr:acyl-CoA dehydrogenase family protein [Nesterenkonia salmonea]TLP93666.1 acyl-CoA dehydrogenase [Nesterenkonia salmonea]
MTNLLYTDIEDALRESVRGAMERHLDPHSTTGIYDEPKPWESKAWQSLTEELGVAGLLVPEDSGGVGAGPREAAVVLEEIGRAVAPVPYLTSSVIATQVLLQLGESEHIASLAAGETTAALVLPWAARPGHWSPAQGTDPVKPVAGAVGADLLLIPVADAGGFQLQLVKAADTTVDPLVSFDMTRPLAAVTLASGEVLATGEEAQRAVEAGLQAGAALLASEQYGLARSCLETTVDYVKNRIQFARPIGSFQAIKHRLADLYLEVTQAGAAARYAAAALADDDPDKAVAISVAQAYCSDVAVHAAEEAVQLHGGNGMTWEYPVHLYLKRAKSSQLALGTPEKHRQDLGPLVNITT